MLEKYKFYNLLFLMFMTCHCANESTRKIDALVHDFNIDSSVLTISYDYLYNDQGIPIDSVKLEDFVHLNPSTNLWDEIVKRNNIILVDKYEYIENVRNQNSVIEVNPSAYNVTLILFNHDDLTYKLLGKLEGEYLYFGPALKNHELIAIAYNENLFYLGSFKVSIESTKFTVEMKKMKLEKYWKDLNAIVKSTVLD